MIPLFKHNIGEEDIERCVEVLKSNWHTAGPIGEQVEDLISEYYGGYHCALTSSCTSGLLAVTLAIGLKEGDEVLIPAMTFTATAASVMHYGAKPVFVDIDSRTGLIDVDKIEDKITDKTKAIFIVNLYGHMPNIERISQIANNHNLFLLEDCAHAFDSKRHGSRPATFSDAAVYSFYATKTMHCGEGGAVISRDKDLIDKVKIIRRHGLSKWPRPGQPGNMGYNVIALGFKGVLSDIHASLLISQVQKADEYRQERDVIAQRYFEYFRKLKNIVCLMPDKYVESSWYTFPTIISSPKKRKHLSIQLNEAGVGHTVMYQSLEEFDVYNVHPLTKVPVIRGNACPIAKVFGNTQLSLPCYPRLTPKEQETIIKIVEEWDSCF
jgi:UDP-4-amino-4-deoxy-L-arabinose-oxoglutarate aminotransferase